MYRPRLNGYLSQTVTRINGLFPGYEKGFGRFPPISRMTGIAQTMIFSGPTASSDREQEPFAPDLTLPCIIL